MKQAAQTRANERLEALKNKGGKKGGGKKGGVKQKASPSPQQPGSSTGDAAASET